MFPTQKNALYNILKVLYKESLEGKVLKYLKLIILNRTVITCKYLHSIYIDSLCSVSACPRDFEHSCCSIINFIIVPCLVSDQHHAQAAPTVLSLVPASHRSFFSAPLPCRSQLPEARLRLRAKRQACRCRTCCTCRIYPASAGCTTRYIPRERASARVKPRKRRGRSPRRFRGFTRALALSRGI